MKTQLQVLSEKLREFFPKTELPVMFMLISIIVIGVIYNILTDKKHKKTYLCPACGQAEKKNERYIF